MKLLADSENTLPNLPDGPLIVFDGVCVLCSRFARFVIEHDPDRAFYFTTAQSELGQAMYRHFDLNATVFETNIVVIEGNAWGELDAFAQVMARLPRPYRWLKIVHWLPEPLSGWLYRRIARNRYRVFGKTETCMIPPADWRDHFIG